MRQGSPRPWTATAAALLLLLVGCGGGSGKARSGVPSNPPRAHDPVTKFAAAETGLHDDGEFALDGTTVWVSTQEGLKYNDVATGDSGIVKVYAGRPVLQKPQLGAPVVARVAERTVVLSVAPVTRPGTGTRVTTYTIMLLAVDARTHEEVWRTEIPSDAFATGVDLKIAGVDGDTAVVTYGADMTTVDLTTHRMVWRKPNAPSVVAVGVGTIAVVASDRFLERQVYGLSVANGERTWT
ncbi:PQQ-binding-like beta-propeller repeat protein [Streptomyces sp. NPDC001508]|uniref:outer membrane protein assembly factor BamB family protein n=1 Tax=Streptomyces sp. NPDC001508 TaxID=3154656 RepID=UPI0033170BE5